MAVELLTFDEIYDLGKTELNTLAPTITDFSEGSIADAMLGITATMAEEIQTILVDRFNNTFIELAENDKLDTLLTDHFGSTFARPLANKATGIVEFSRPTFTAGAVTIPAATVVSTVPDANGDTQKFVTLLEVILGATDLTVNASVEAQIAGSAGNVASTTVVVIDSSLTDPTVVVTNSLSFTGGTEKATDAEYREFARNRIETIRGGTCTALEATAKTVPGVEFSKAVEIEQTVIEFDVPTASTIGSPFSIPRTRLYIADANGVADQTLIDAVILAIADIKACGIRIDVLAAIGITLAWDFSIVLNPTGPNFPTLSLNATEIRKSAQAYINNLAIGQDFIRLAAETAVLAIWGPLGTDDLVSIDTNTPTGDVDADPTEKFLASLSDISIT